MVDLSERIEVLLCQENASYTTVDYLKPGYQDRLFSSGQDYELESSSLSTSTGSSSSGSGLNEHWREKIVEWSYQVVDHFDFSREVVSVSIHYLDRFLAQKRVNKKAFQLVAMSSLLVAIKLYEPGRLSMASMIELSRGFFTVEQLIAMELELLRVLSWQVHPPTAYCFSKHLLFLLPYASISMELRHDLLELARFLTELSVIDFFFVSVKASSVAVAALLHAMEETPGVSKEAKGIFVTELRKLTGLDPESLEVQECRKRLRQTFAQGGYAPTQTTAETRDEAVSPVCVSYPFTVQYEPASSPDAPLERNDVSSTTKPATHAGVNSQGSAVDGGGLKEPS